MLGMDKTFLLGFLASTALGALIMLPAIVFAIDPDIVAVLVVLGVCGSGLIGEAVSRRMKSPQRPR